MSAPESQKGVFLAKKPCIFVKKCLQSGGCRDIIIRHANRVTPKTTHSGIFRPSAAMRWTGEMSGMAVKRKGENQNGSRIHESPA